MATPRALDKSWPVPNNAFDGTKFKARYSLTSSQFEAFHVATQLHVRLMPGVTIPDDPPIFDPPDTPQDATHKALVAYLTSSRREAIFDRALLLALVDAINTIRAALVPPLPAITKAQVLTALTNKINSGQAD